MIVSVKSSGESVALSPDLPSGAEAFVDRDWVPDRAEERVPAVVVHADGSAHWDGTKLSPASDHAAAQVAMRLLRTVAEAAASAVRGSPAVNVRGNGAIAAETRRMSGEASARQTRPTGKRRRRYSGIVDVTGDPEVITEALSELDDGGVLVLAGEPLGRSLTVNLYKDVHVRGLRVLGIGRPRSGGDRHRAGGELPAPRRVVAGESLAPAPWYCVQG